jgi:7-carboxy-7-deazaguanine synthase
VGSMQGDASQEKGAGTLRIAEIYASRQGEGQWTGEPSVFVRVSGCNLRCWFCDTPFASWTPEGQTEPLAEVLARVLSFPEQHVVVTGGEPLIFPATLALCTALRAAGKVVTIETAGTVDTPVSCDLLSLSPKLSSSAPDPEQHPAWHRAHQQRRQRADLVRSWIQQHPYQLKFVIANLTDFQEVLEYLAQIPEARPEHVWLMPEGTDTATLDVRTQWLEPLAQEHRFHFCPRSHIYWFGNRRGT